MKKPHQLATRLIALTLTLTAFAQTTQPKPELLLFHASGPMPSYEVATVKPLDPNAAASQMRLPPGMTLNPLSIRRYIMNAYAATYSAQVIGGPHWLEKDGYDIKGKVPDDLKAALDKMPREDAVGQTRMMQQDLLAERFHLKAHFETRILPVYELVPAKGGLKITGVPAPPERKTGDPPISVRAGQPLPPGTIMSNFNGSGLRVIDGHAIKMQMLARVVGGDVGDRPIVDHTGFTGSFDISGFTWAPLGDANAASQPDAPSLIGALEQKLGIKVVATKAPIEVLVIDSIDRPTAN